MLTVSKLILIHIVLCGLSVNSLNGKHPKYKENTVFSRKSREADSDKVYEIEKCFNLLESGLKKITLTDQKDIVLVLGKTGSGKSAFSQWLIGDDSKLMAEKIGAGRYKISDTEDKVAGLFESKTITPDIFYGLLNKTVFYDCPGFAENRGFSHDISQSFFIKMLTDHAERLKFVLIVNYEDLKIGETKTGFTDLLRFVTGLNKNIGNYKDSFAIVATKVDIEEDAEKGAEEEIIDDIGNFILECRQHLVYESKTWDNNSIEWKRNNEMTKLTDALLTKNQKGYSKIGLFRMPQRQGLLSENEFLKKDKKLCTKIVYETLEFSQKRNEDFGYAIAETSKNLIFDLVDFINNNIASNATALCKEVRKELRGSLNMAIDFKSNSEVDDKMLVLETLVEKLDEVNYVAKLLRSGVNELNGTGYFIDLLNQTTEVIHMELSDDFLKRLKNLEKYFHFLQTVSGKKLNDRYSELTDMLEQIINTIDTSKKSVYKNLENVEKKIVIQLKSEIPRETGIFKEKVYLKNKNSEIETLPNQFGKFVEITELLEFDMKLSRNYFDLLEISTTLLQKLNFSDSKVQLNKEILSKMAFLLMIQTVTGGNAFNDVKAIFMDEIKSLKQHFSDSTKWYTFLIDLYATFSEFGFQSQKSSFNVANIEDWGKASKNQGIQITEINFKQFLNQIKHHTLREQNYIENLKPSPAMLEDLNEVLRKTLKTEVQIICPSRDTMIVKGSFIKFSDFLDSIPSSCGSVENMKSIELLALEVIFIDRNFNATGQKLKLSLIAPKWQVVGSKIIVLDGERAFDVAPLFANSGSLPGSNGEDGRSGPPGGSSGSFLGICEACVNVEKLTITANGGRGGSGQSGGRGEAGEDGTDGKLEDTGKCRFRGNPTMSKSAVSHIGGDALWVETYTGEGNYGTSGGLGGCFGFGALGGMPGNIDFSFKNHEIEIKNETGSNGRNGIQGENGKNGKNGRNLIKICHIAYYKIGDIIPLDFVKKFARDVYGRKEYFEEMPKDNENSKANSRACNQQRPSEQPKPASVIENKANILNDYKQYFIGNFGNRFTKRISISFKAYLEATKAAPYETLDFVEELKTLESLKVEPQNLLPFYETFITRLENYAKSLKQSSNFDEQTKVLKYVFTAAQSTIFHYRHDYESNFVVNINSYLKVITKNIESLDDLNGDRNVLQVINDCKQKYSSEFDRKVEEAQSLIDSQITPELTKLENQLDNEVHALILEIATRTNKTIGDRKKLMQEETELKRKLVLRKVLGTLKIAGTAVSFLGPKGAVVGMIINGGAAIAESQLLHVDVESPIQRKIREDIKKNHEAVSKQTSSINDKKAKKLSTVIDHVKNEIDKTSDKDFKDISDKLANIKKDLTEANKENDSEKIAKLEEKFKTELKNEEKRLTSKKDKFDAKLKQRAAVMKGCNAIVDIATVSYKAFNDIKNDEAKIENVKNLIDQSQDIIFGFDKKRDEVSKILLPMIRNIQKNTESQLKSLEKKSPVVLDINKWQVQNSLKKTIAQLNSFTIGFEKTQENYKNLIENMKEAMSTLINVYDRIQNYQDQQALGNYIANINSASVQNTKIVDEALSSAVRDLEAAIRSRLILSQYDLAVNAFKQWVFPLAENYLTFVRTPMSFKYETNSTNNLMFQVTEQIKTIHSKIQEYNSLITKNEAHIMKGDFNSEKTSSEPFYVWENSYHTSMMRNLLSGEEVVVNADINRGPDDKDAIKFNYAEFYFKTSNQTLQPELNRILNGFKMSATHMGNSHYRFNENFFTLTSSSIEIVYSLEKHTNGDPIHKNEVYSKLRAGDIILSPYAVWKLKLTHISGNTSFDVLSKIFRDKVNLELVGLGKYIEPNKIKVKAENFYKLDEY